MKEEADDLKKPLTDKFGETINFKYVDVQDDEMKDYPDIKEMLSRVRLPLTVIDGEPTFHGGLSINKITEVINKKLK
jgi:disulfide oxidoreductase YuzD